MFQHCVRSIIADNINFKSNSRARNIYSIVCWQFSLLKKTSSAMSSFLAVCILLVGHLFSSSATSLKTIKLASEESSQAQALTASPIGFSVTTLNSNITKLVNLNGYVYDVVYTDSVCSTFALAELQVLNICFRFSATKYKFITASSALVTYNTYTDAQCTLGGSNTIHVYESKVCSGQRRTFISETSNFIPTIAVGFQR